MTAAMGREQAEAASHGSCGSQSCGSEQGAGDMAHASGTEAQSACDAEQGCGVDKSFLNRKQSQGGQSGVGIDDLKGRETRRKFVNMARVIFVVGLALSWLTELGGEAVSNHERNISRMYISDSMLSDLQAGGTVFGAVPSMRNDIHSLWGREALDDERLWHDEDNARAFNWLVLMAISAGAGYLFIAPKGKAIVEEYIENGVPEKAIKRL
jgi:hypothetical protein